MKNQPFWTVDKEFCPELFEPLAEWLMLPFNADGIECFRNIDGFTFESFYIDTESSKFITLDVNTIKDSEVPEIIWDLFREWGY